MNRLSCCLLSIVLVLVILDGTSARRASCGKGVRDRSGQCRDVLSLFKKLLQDVDDGDQGTADNEGELSPDTKRDEEADLRTLLYGQDPDEDPTDTDEGMIANEGEEDMSAYKTNLILQKYELEMKLVEALVRDLENFNNDEFTSNNDISN